MRLGGVQRLLRMAGVLTAAPAFLWLGAHPALAEPYLAVRSSGTCLSCHVNRTGGGQRNAFGAEWGRTFLPWTKLEDVDLMDGSVTRWLRLGADLRGAYRGSIPDSGSFIGSYEISDANLYLSAEIVPDRVTLYVDERVAPGSASSREAFALIRSRKAALYAKAGRFFPPYGWRLQDDQVPIRRFTGFNFASSDTGVEVGAEPGRWSLALAVTNGSGGGAEIDNGKKVSFIGSYVRDLWRLGLSVSSNDLPGSARQSLGGVFGGYRAGPVGFLGEWDVIRVDEVDGSTTYSGVAHLQVDGVLHDGIDIRAWWGRFNADRDLGGDSQDQAGIGVDWTPIPGVQVRGFWRVREGPATVAGSRDDEVVLELHLYF